jgi:hypothetical protein
MSPPAGVVSLKSWDGCSSTKVKMVQAATTAAVMMDSGWRSVVTARRNGSQRSRRRLPGVSTGV